MALETPVFGVGPWFEQWSQWHYMAALVFCLVVTAPLEFVIGARVYRRPVRLVTTLLVASTPFVIWDFLAIEAGHWWFSPAYTLGVAIGPFPIEELLFFAVIPIAALVTFEAVTRLRGRRTASSGRAS